MRSQIQQKMAAKPTLEELLESDCDVCFVSFNRVTPKRVEEGLQILFCSRCYIHVHKCCYDFQPSLTVLSQKVSEFLCDRCRGESPQGLKCLVCQGTQGAMKKIGEKEFIHVYCGLMHNDIEVVSYYPSITFKRSAYYEENNHTCEICHLKNAHQHCAEDTCKRKVHVYCAKKHYFSMSKEVEEPKSWNHRMSVGNHGNFDLSDQIIPYELLSEEVETSLHQFQEIGFDLPFKEELKRKIHRQYLQQTRSRRKSTKKLRRGGFSYVVCPQHQSISYCLCYGKADGQDMVLCECCFEWYHHKCVKYTTTEDSYICAFCKTFYQFKRKAVQEVKGGRTEYDVSKLQLPLKISVMDVIWVLRVLDNRIRGGLAGKMLKQLYKYPLKSSCMDLLIRHQNRNKLSALADDCLLHFSTSEEVEALLRPRTVLATDAEGRPFVVADSVNYNRLIRKGIEVLLGMGIRGQGFAAILKELEFKERALSDSYEQIIELSKVEQNYQEVQILKQKAQAYNFIEIIKKINEKTPVSIQELQESLTKAQSVASLPTYLAQTLRDKFNAVSPLIQRIGKEIRENPENGYVITQLVEELQGLDVLPPLEYHQLTMQRKFVQNMYLYMVKQEGNKIEEELTVQQKIDLLLAFSTLKPNQELIDIISTYKPTNSSPIWKNIDQLLAKYQTIAVEFQIKEIIKRRYCKQERFAAIVERAREYNCVSAAEDVRAVVQGWKEIQVKFQSSISASLEGLGEYDDICELLKTVANVIEAIQNFAIKIQEDNPGKSWIGLAKTRKEELEQLKILYTESQLQKNPLTLSKILPSLPKNNPLVKQWHSLKKQQSNFHNKFTTILARVNERLQFFKNQKKLQRKEQIKENCDKPSISQITEFIDMLKHSNVDMGKEMKELTRFVNNSLEVAGKVKKYIEEKGDCSLCNLEELSNRRKEIDEQRRKVLTIAQLSLKSQLIELYHLEICNRMRTSLISPGLELQKISTLLKFAEEEGLTHAETYIALKDKYETSNQKSKEVSLIKSLEQSLAAQASKDLSPNFAHLFVFRKGLSLPEITESKTKIIYTNDLIEKNKQIREKISNALQQRPGKWDLNQARLLYLQALKNPYFQPELNRMSVQVTKACDLQRKWKEIGRSFNHLHPIFLDYEILTFSIEEIESVKREIKNNEDQIGRLHLFVSSFNEANRDQLEEIIERIENTNVIKETEICKQAELKYLNYWVKFLQYSKTNKKTVPYEKIRRLTLDSYNLLQKNLRLGEDYDQLKTIIYQLQDYLILVKNHLKSYPTYSLKTCIADSFIDLQQFYLENDDEEQEIADFITILRPFSDLSKFRVKNLQRLEVRREQLTSKRSRDKFQDLRGESDKHIPKESQPQSSESLPQVVSQTERRKIKQIFLKNIRKNPELKKYGQCQNQVKMIQNQIFGEWHNDIIKYFQMSEQFQKLFIKLVNCPNISNKIIKKKFQFKFIQILVSNLAKIDELEGMIVSKIKEIETEKTISKISETINQKNLQLERENQAVIQSIATGKVDQSLKQDLKKEMKLLKEGKQKKKSKHKHRSRSRSPDAKFSEESQKELPVYIREEYHQDQAKPNDKKPEPSKQKMTDSPLRYDPQEDELQSREVIFPRGSILKLKNCDLEISTKKKGKIQFAVQILTEEEHKKILAELFDPGFSRLSIKKDKNQSQIIQYISKSKKKYKYLITWFQAVKPQDNEILKDIANDANDKKKIFGWQNEHIKIHIMSLKQLVQINRFSIPARVTSPSAANHLNNERVIMIVQYPQKVYEVREHYKQFADIQRKSQEYSVFVPPAVVEAPIYDFYPKYTMPTIEPLAKPTYEEPKMIYQGGWGDSGATSIPPPPIPQPLPPQIVNVPVQNAPPASNLPYKVNQIRMHFNINSFSPILTDQDDMQEQKNNGDLASDLLNSLGDFGKMPPQQPPPSIPREKPQPQPQQQHQQYQGYYGGYSYQPPARSAPPADNRWSGYPSMSQPMNQPMSAQSQVYNPLNPMAGKYPNPPMNPHHNQMYKNPMMGQPQPRPPNLGGQYYRPPPGEGYDPRYQGGYQQ